jgi:predicted nucleic acid-binding Zn ribbon protein
MPQPLSPLDPSSETARALSPAPVVRSCPACGAELTGRQKCCSGKCRAALSRRRRIPVKAEDLRDLRAMVKMTLENLWEAKVKLDKLLGGA